MNNTLKDNLLEFLNALLDYLDSETNKEELDTFKRLLLLITRLNVNDEPSYSEMIADLKEHIKNGENAAINASASKLVFVFNTGSIKDKLSANLTEKLENVKTAMNEAGVVSVG